MLPAHAGSLYLARSSKPPGALCCVDKRCARVSDISGEEIGELVMTVGQLDQGKMDDEMNNP